MAKKRDQAALWGSANNVIDSGAEFSPCRKYRFALWRIWDKNLPFLMFIGLNPSTANETEPDPTITRVMRMADKWCFGGVFMLNCFPFITSDPDKLEIDEHSQFVNDCHLESVGKRCSEIVFAWGSFPIVKKTARDKELIAKFPNASALVINQDGSPRHPLYVPYKVERRPFKNE